MFYTLTYTHTLLRRVHELGRAPRTNHKDGRCSLLALRLSCTLIGHAYIAPGTKAPGFTVDGGMKTGQLSLLMEPSVLTSHTAGTSTNLLNEQNLRNSDARSAETAGPGGGRHLHQVCLGQAVTATRSAPGAGPGLSSLHSEPLQPTSHAGRRARAAGADGLSSEGGQLALCGRRLTLTGQRDLSHTPLTGQGLPTCPLYPFTEEMPESHVALGEFSCLRHLPLLYRAWWRQVPSWVPRRREEGVRTPCGREG